MPDCKGLEEVSNLADFYLKKILKLHKTKNKDIH